MSSKISLMFALAAVGTKALISPVEVKAQEKPQKQTVKNKDFTIPSLNMDLIYIKNGSFKMGSPNAGPMHKVTISKPYWIGKYEVTQAEYKTLTKKHLDNKKNATKPVENINWSVAMSFCKKITELEAKAGRLPKGYEYRLPTEAEWEFAARGGNNSKGYKYSGNHRLRSVAWYDDNSDFKTHPVGKKEPNELGLYDMSGNVSEWCYDWHSDYNKNAKSNPHGPKSGSARIHRGGSYDFIETKCETAHRAYSSEHKTHSTLGFRVCLAPRIQN